MNWFKMLWLNSEEREILRRAKEGSTSCPQPVGGLPTHTAPAPTPYGDAPPYKNVFYSNGNLTVVFEDGSVLSKSNVTSELFAAVRDAKTEREIDNLLIEKTPAEAKELKQEFETQGERYLVSQNLGVFYDNSEFEVKGTDVYMKGVNLPLPASVIASFIEILEEREWLDEFPEDAGEDWSTRNIANKANYDALKMFWLKLALNTLPQSRKDLLTFVRKNDVRITRNGNLILYRRIVTKQGTDTKLVAFISQQYYRLKKEGFDTRQFAVAKNGNDYALVDLNEYDGSGEVPFINLQVAYLELPTYQTNQFTAWHDKRVNIRVGGIYKIPDSGINLDNGICAAGGLHAAAVDYDYSGFGDLPVVVLVNPSKAITVPLGETGKLRTTEMFIACVNDKEAGVHFDESALGSFDEEYHDLTLTELEDAAKSKSFEKLSVQDTVPAVSLVDLNVIKDMLRKRIKEIV